MAGFQFKVKFFTLFSNNISEKNVSVHQYYGKDAITNGEYHGIKKEFVLSQGGMWVPRNKRPDKLRESIKIFEDVLKSNEIVFACWKKRNVVQVVFDSGMLAYLQMSVSNDISKITFDRGLVGKISSASSGIHGEHFVCFSSENQTKLTFSTLKPDMKMYTVDLPGPQAKISRYLSINATEELMVCWWHFGAWIQTAREEERINIVLLRCSFGRLEVVSSIETENELICAEFSKVNPNQILTLEKSYNVRKEGHLDSVMYECTRNVMQRLSVTSFPLKSGVLSFARNSTEDKVAVGCNDGSIVIFDLTIQKALATLSRSPLVPTIIKWVGPMLLVGSAQGELKLFDSALNSLFLYDVEEGEFPSLQLSEFLTSGSSLIKVLPFSFNDMLLVFNGGPFASLNLYGKFSNLDIIKQHILNDKETEAINLLCSFNWNYDCDDAYHGLLAIADWLLQKPLNHEREVQLEATFASFYASKHQIADSIVLKCRTTIGCYARRFFHHLLRHQRFEKAFLLAKDINSSDLFLDIYFAAKDIGEIQLAKVAKLKADEISAAESSDNDSEEDWKSLAEEHLSNLVPRSNKRDHLARAMKQEFATSENSSSTLKVTNLGYV